MKIFRYVLPAIVAAAALSVIPLMTSSATKAVSVARTERQSDDVRRDHSIVIFVSATDGNDHWSGRFPFPSHDRADGPLATLDQAREVVQSIDKSATDRVTVFFRGGTHYLPGTVTFADTDSGTARTEIVYSNFPGESPVFSGGVRVEN